MNTEKMLRLQIRELVRLVRLKEKRITELEKVNVVDSTCDPPQITILPAATWPSTSTVPWPNPITTTIWKFDDPNTFYTGPAYKPPGYFS